MLTNFIYLQNTQKITIQIRQCQALIMSMQCMRSQSYIVKFKEYYNILVNLLNNRAMNFEVDNRIREIHVRNLYLKIEIT